MLSSLKKNTSGVELIMLIVMSGVLLAIFTAGFLLINAEKRLTIRSADREKTLAIAEAGINYYRWHLAHSPEDYADGNDIYLSDISKSGYTEAYLDVGSTYYIDAASTILTLPESLEQALWIKTAQADAANTAENFLSFWVNRGVSVSIGYDNRGTAPDWLSTSFTNSGETIQVSDAASPLRVWKKEFAAGSTVTLGGNLAAGASGALSMYTITISPLSGNGPFLHEYTDFDGNVIGQYRIEVTPPSLGSTITTVSSTGSLLSNPDSTRTIVARFGIPSLSEYAVLANDVMRFGEGTETFGKIHSNYGIRFDGLAHGLITSACSTYDDPDHSGPAEDCVHTHEPNPNAVFEGGRSFPVAPIDFNGITGDLANLKSAAQEPSGIYLPPSGVQGYHIVLKTNDRMDIYRVTSQSSCQYRILFWWYAYEDVFSINAQSSFTYHGSSSLNLPFPANGIIFAEDNVWVNGTIDGAKLTIAAAREPLASGNANIIVNNDLRYTNDDGSDTIGLIAQNDFHIGFYSEDNLEIDAAIIAQKGRVGRPYYQDQSLPDNRYNPNACGDYVYRDTVTLDGAIATNERYGFAYTDNTGYQNRNLYFDENLIFSPPPLFPTSGEYVMISWEEQ